MDPRLRTEVGLLWEARQPLGVRFGAVAIGAMTLALAASGAWLTSAGAVETGIVLALVGAASHGVAILVGLAPRLQVRERGIMVRNAVFDYWIPWAEVREMSAHGARIEVLTRSGGCVEVAAVQSANIALLLGRPGRAGRYLERLEHARKSVASPEDRGVQRRLACSALLTVVRVVGVLLISTVLEVVSR